MGKLIWSDWARLVSISASVYLIWAGFWGIFYRKFFWDFIGGTLIKTETQSGLIPGPNSAPFLAIIVTVPLVQIFSMILGIVMVMIEMPPPFLKGTIFTRSIPLKIIMLVIEGFLGALFYQGTNAAIWSIVAIIAYTRAQIRGEILLDAQENRGKAGAA